ncbi:odorant receptor 42b-like [Eurosta solidaginis]|uniref:odorant receptor 42b-like n=1 Tax=Eurosta solidaginis TaxID=178769 RepID=UPI0035308473
MLELLRGRGRVVFKSRDALIYIFNIFTYAGTNPPEHKTHLYTLYATTANFICILFCPFSFHMGYISSLDELNKNELLSAIQNAVQVTGISIKVIVIIGYMKRLKKALAILDELDQNYTHTEDLMKIRKCVQTCCKIVAIFCIPYYGFEISTISLGVFQHRNPLSIWLPYFNIERTEWEYWCVVVWDIVIMFILLLHQLSIDTYPPVYISIMRTHMQLLVARVARLGKNREMSEDENYAELLACIQTHRQIKYIANLVAPAISITLLVQFGTSATTMLNWFGAVEFPENIIAFAFFCCQLIQILPCSYMASNLIADCDQLPYAIFHSNWIDRDRRYRKTILFFIQRAQIPLRFSCLKLFYVNLATGISIGKFAFSIYTLLQKTGVNSKPQ